MKRVLCMLMAAGFIAFSGEWVLGQNKEVQAAGQEKKGKLNITALKQQTVVSIDAGKNTLVIKGKDGVEQEIVLAGATKVKKGKVKIALADIASGDTVTVYFKGTKDGQKEPSTVKVMKPRSN